LAEYHSICEHLVEPEEEGEKELFLTKELTEYEEGQDDGEIAVVRRALSGLAAPENHKKRGLFFTLDAPLVGRSAH